MLKQNINEIFDNIIQDQNYYTYPTYQQINVNGYYYLNNKDVKIKLTNGSFVKGKIVNQNIMFTSDLLEVLVSTSKKQITRFIPHDKILLIDLI
jgi:hypothetical protein